MSARLLQTNAQRHSTGSRPTVLVLDRATDIATPLLHEFTYQAICQDLLEVSDSGVVQRDAVAGSGEAQRKVEILTDEDDIWRKHKHRYFGDVCGDIPDDFKKFQAASGVANFEKVQADGRAADLKVMADVVKELPRYSKKKGKFAMHIGLSEAINKAVEQRKLLDLRQAEMDMVFGEDASGSSLLGSSMLGNAAKLRKDLVDLLNKATNESDRARVLAVLQVTSPQLAATLLETGDLLPYPSEHAAAEATVKRLAAETAGEPYATRGWKTDKHEFAQYKYQNMKDAVSRYKPALYWTANDIIDPAKGLDSDAYPYCGEDASSAPPAFMQASVCLPKPSPLCARTPSTRVLADSLYMRAAVQCATDSCCLCQARHRSGTGTGSGTSWRGGRARTSAAPRLIIFVAGGIAYSECRAAYELAEKFPGVQVRARVRVWACYVRPGARAWR